MTQSEFYLVMGSTTLISVTMLIIGIISYIRTKNFLAGAVETRGVVIENVYKGSDEGSSMYSPKIRFTDSMGQAVEFTENWSTNRPDYAVGGEVIVLYNPAEPQKARRGGKKWKFFFVAWLLGGLGLLFTGMMIFMAILFLVILKMPIPDK